MNSQDSTLTLFAAMDYLQGRLISSIETQHRHQQWLAFLKKINRETPKGLQLHLIVDNYATHKHPVVKEWLKRHPRFHMHFTPTSSSWMNMVERFFRDITVFLLIICRASGVLFVTMRQPSPWASRPGQFVEHVRCRWLQPSPRHPA
jgi:transposase